MLKSSPILAVKPLDHVLQLSFTAPLQHNSRTRRITLSKSSRKCIAARSAAESIAASAAKLDLRQLEGLLSAGKEEDAVALATELKSSGVLRAFGAAAQVPKRAYTMEELRLNKIDTKEFLSPADATLNNVRNILQGGFLAGLTAAYFASGADLPALLPWVIASAALLTADQVAHAGGVEALLVDSAGRAISPTYSKRVALHEAGHFLVAYLLGLLPKSYTLSSWDAFAATRAFNVQAGTTFCDAAFQLEVASGRLSSGSLDTFSCVALAGVATEWLRFGHAEGGLSDVQQLDNLLRALRFSQAKADAQVRFAVLNVVTLLRRHERVHDELAAAMSRRASVGECVGVIERALAGSDDI